MNDNGINKMPRIISSATENDNIDETLIYENALKNLQREIEEKQKILSKLQVKINPAQAFDVAVNQRNVDEYDYLKNKDAVQRIKDQAADVLIGELKNINSNLKRKINDIDEKERRISSRLIELEERQAILEEIDYVQRMIPKKIMDENFIKSIKTKQELDINIENMFKPAVNVIADKTTNKLTKGMKLYSEESKTELKTPSIEQEHEIIEIKPQQEVKKEVPVQNKPRQEVIGDIAGVVIHPKTEKRQEEQPDNIKKQEGINTHPEITDKHSIKNVPIQKSTPQQTKPVAVNVLTRDAKSKKSINAKPERKGMHIQERNWKNFAYIKDSKVKLKQDDLLNISKSIMDIEQGKFSLKGI